MFKLSDALILGLAVFFARLIHLRKVQYCSKRHH